jgi:uncharacterized membrane protein YhaH (DUF805 family)
MDFGTAIQVCFQKYVDFSGRARRSEYWFFYLFTFLTVFGASIVSESLGNLVFLAVLLPSLSASVRRMHDAGKSGWFLLIPIYSLILALTDSQPGPNQWGAPVK